MKAWQIIILSILVFSCKTERTVLVPNRTDFSFGSADFPTIYWGNIDLKDNNFGDYKSRRALFLYFFDKNQVFYRLGSKEDFGGNSLVSIVETENNKLLISSDYRNGYSDMNWTDYQIKFFINEWKIKNDSTLLGRNGEILTKQRQDTKPVFDDNNITEYEYLNYHLKAYLNRQRNKN